MTSMANNTHKIAKLLGAKVVGPIPDVGGGAFGASRLGRMVATLQSRLQPSKGKRPGRPTNPSWVHSPKIPMSQKTQQKLAQLAEQASQSGRQVSPMQLAAQLLEDALARL